MRKNLIRDTAWSITRSVRILPRITEFKYLTGQKNTDGTTIVKEYPFAYTGAEGEIPYYAILEPKNQELYEKYPAACRWTPHFYLLGRLAEYKYYNIDAMTKKAMELAERSWQKIQKDNRRIHI